VNLNETYQSLKTTLLAWPHLFVNRRDKKDEENHKISWSNYTRRNLVNNIRRSDLIEMANTGQYSFQMITDGSLFQLYYEFNNYDQILSVANLAYYSTGELSLDNFQELQYLDNCSTEPDHAISMSESSDCSENPLIAWMRIDYSPHNYCRPLHHSCHFHFSQFPNARISLNAVPSPRQFIEFIIALNYPHLYTTYRLNHTHEPNDLTQIMTYNSPCFPSIDSNVYNILPYLRIPNH